MRRELQDKLELCTALPTFPAIAVRILHLCQEDQLNLGQIANAISLDAALAAKLLKTVNSPLFAIRREVTSISQALGFVGVNAVRTLVLTFSLSKVSRSVKQPGLQDYWRRSILSGLAARELCPEFGFDWADDAFLCGLLQDVGILALYSALGPQYGKLLKASGNDHDKLVNLERNAIGSDHSEVGGWLMKLWRMPQLLTDIVAASHDPEQASPNASPQYRFLARSVALSGRFADLWAQDLIDAPIRLRHEISRHWQQSDLNVEALTSRLIEMAREVGPLFELSLDPGAESRLLQQAQEMLLGVSVRTSREITDMQEAIARLETRTAMLLADSQRDALTGVANRGHIDLHLEDAFHAAARSSQLVGIIFADVDHFKRINDTHGHGAGDSVLKSIAQAITDTVRSSDLVGRYGGDEFIVVARIEQPRDLLALAERVRRAVLEFPHSVGGANRVTVTISMGCAIIDPNRHRTYADAVVEADRVLYASKRAGRNRAAIGGAPRPPSTQPPLPV